MSRPLPSARRTRRIARVDPLARQMRVDIDAGVQPPAAAARAVPPARVIRAAAQVARPRPPGRAVRVAAQAAPAPPRPGDSDWEWDSDSDDSDFEPGESTSGTESDDSDLDYVSLHDSSLDSDEPLSNLFDAALQRRHKENAPGKAAFFWRRRENVPRRYGFAGRPGVQPGHLDADSSARELFDLFYTPDLWKTTKEETNRYADQNRPKPSSHMKNWEDVDEEELQRYLGLRLLMGVHVLPSIRDYWSTNPLLQTPAFREQMTRDRFDAITSHLHFSDNRDPQAADDRLWKIRPVVDCFSKQFKDVYVPEREVTVDESLFRFKGRHHAIQYVPSKRARFGLKAYKLCQSSGLAAGYTSAFRMYMGQDRSEMPASQKAVVNLMDDAGLFDLGYDLYTDNWYSSPTLFHYLQSRMTNAAGTVRPSRKWMPKDLQVRRKGDVDRRSSPTGQLCLAWMDRKQVTMLSTIHRGSETVTLPPNRRGEERVKPLVVADYNRGMKGVDLSDQLATSYSSPRKCRKWYHNLFFHLIDTAVVNAYSVHKVLGGRKTHLDFRLDLITSLFTRRRHRDATPRPAPLRPALVHGRRMDAQHLLVSAPKPRRCKHCRTTRNARRDVKFQCSVCDVGLCPGECFNNYHQA